MMPKRLLMACVLGLVTLTTSVYAQNPPTEPPPTEPNAQAQALVQSCKDKRAAGQLDAALADCQQALALLPNDPALLKEIAELEEAQAQKARAEKVKALLADCREKRTAGKLDEALSVCKQAAEIDPGNAEVTTQVAELEAEKKKAADPSGATSMIPGDKGKKNPPPHLNRDSKEAQEARKAAMGKMAADNPGKGGGGKFQPADKPTIKPPTPRETAEPLVRLEHHGYFRFRADLFSNLDLDTKGTTPIGPPLESRDSQVNYNPAASGFAEDEILAGANIRFRYAPTLHIGEDLRVNLIVDVLDNLVLGSTPDGLRAGRLDIPILAFTGGTEEPRVDTVGKDSIIVRSAFAEWRTPFGLLRVGRQPSHWGLGILANGGGDAGTGHTIRKQLGTPAWQCIDCDFGDYVDRAMFISQEPFTRAFWWAFGWDFVSEGLVGYNAQNDSYGQAFDLGQADDVIQIVASLFSRPILPKQVEQRNRDLRVEPRTTTFDWGVYFVYREQDLDAKNFTRNDFQGLGSTRDLQIRGATAYIPNVWLRLLMPFGFKHRLRLEFEATGIFGTIDRVTESAGNSRSITQFGAAFEGEYQWNDLFVGLNAGFASGKDTFGYGYLDILAVSDQVRDINNFRFDRNYIIDMIMFRELVGGITNAVYFDPWAQYQFPLAGNNLGARLDLITAVAPKPESTPGNGTWYGFEADLKLFYEEPDRFRAQLAAGFFFPGGAWNRIAEHPDLGGPTPQLPVPSAHPTLQPDEEITATFAWTIQAGLWWMF